MRAFFPALILVLSSPAFSQTITLPTVEEAAEIAQWIPVQGGSGASGSSPIAHLFFVRCPFAILRSVVPIIVDPLDREPSLRTASHIGNETLKTGRSIFAEAPPVADLYAASTIKFVSSACLPVTSTDHFVPNPILSGFAETVGYAPLPPSVLANVSLPSSAGLFSSEASTRQRFAPRQMDSQYIGYISAVAEAFPINHLPSLRPHRFSFETGGGQTPKPLPRQVRNWLHRPLQKPATVSQMDAAFKVASALIMTDIADSSLPSREEAEDIKAWIPIHCCRTSGCCFKVKYSDVQSLAGDLWKIKASGQVIARTDWSRDGQYWRCACDNVAGAWVVHLKANTRCIFPPMQMGAIGRERE